jgi:hypothetical protein
VVNPTVEGYSATPTYFGYSDVPPGVSGYSDVPMSSTGGTGDAFMLIFAVILIAAALVVWAYAGWWSKR